MVRYVVRIRRLLPSIFVFSCSVYEAPGTTGPGGGANSSSTTAAGTAGSISISSGQGGGGGARGRGGTGGGGNAGVRDSGENPGGLRTKSRPPQRPRGW